MGWTYYEYGDDLLGRKSNDPSMLPQFWRVNRWEPVYDLFRWDTTAQKISDVNGYIKSHPSVKAAFAA